MSYPMFGMILEFMPVSVLVFKSCYCSMIFKFYLNFFLLFYLYYIIYVILPTGVLNCSFCQAADVVTNEHALYS